MKNPGGESRDDFDRDLNVRAVVWSGIGLAALTAVAFVVSWFIFRGMETHQERRNPEPLPIPEAAEPALPPGPRLQATPEEDLADMRAQEEALLEHYSLVDAGGEYARIPIERAMELALARGLGQEEGGAPEGSPPAAQTMEGRDAEQ